MEKIQLPALSYKNNELLSGDPDELIFHDKYLESISLGKYLCTNLDTTEGEEERTYDHSFIVFKDSVCGINRYFSYVDYCWMVTLVSNAGKAVDFVMKSKTAADALQKKILSWKLL